MKSIRVCSVVGAVLLSSLPLAQGSGTVDKPRPEHGMLIDNSYANEFLGFWFPIPEGWQIEAGTARAGQLEARKLPGGGIELLVLDRRADKPSGNRIVLSAVEAHGLSPELQAYVSDSIQARIRDSEGVAITREAFPATLGGTSFVREDYKQAFKDGVQWNALVCTKFSEEYVCWAFAADSQEGLEQSVNMLQRLSLEATGRVIGGIVGGVPTGTPIKLPSKIRVSRMVSEKLAIAKVQPTYPAEAQRKHVEGIVVLQALISTTGDVEQLSVISGDPLLIPAALRAVWEWKYQPYLLNGVPVRMETRVEVPFDLVAK